MINVSEVNKSKELNSSKPKRAGGGESFSTYLQGSKEVSNPSISGTSGISVTDAIFAAQMVTDEEEREMRRKMVKRGDALLEKLEEIQAGLLTGEISKDRLIEISRFVKERRFSTGDERINNIIAEIELRVEVELAKLTR